jgi:glutamate-1-semialdehyde 2,1-aminomutase
MVRLVSSGTEAVMTALRLARGYTKRAKVLKFDGCYHGHADTMLVAAGSGLLTGGFASSAGVSDSVASDVFVAPYNGIEAVRSIVKEHGKELAAVIVEPLAGNMGLVPPEPGFLEELRRLTSECGAVLIFDEVISGFRLGFGTFGASHKIKPDLICLGKIIGGGLPLGAFGGKKEIMQQLAPLGKVYQAGTLSGNPAAVAGGLSTLRVLHREPPYAKLEALGKKLADGFNAKARALNLSAHCAVLGGVFTIFWTNPPLKNLADVKKCDTKRYAQFFHGMLARGFYLPPAQFEVAFISSAHGEQEIDAFVRAAELELEIIAGGKA